MSTRRMVVLGARGLLGGYLVDELGRQAGVEVVAHGRASCPLEDPGRVREAIAGAEVVWNCAAYTDVDGAEREPERAYAANATGAENVARAADRANALLVHVSTDFVFDGKLDRHYDEFDAPAPGSQYARSKRAGELLVAQATRRHHVVRVEGLYGDGGRNFVSKLRALLLGGKAGLRIDDERRVQPTFARAVARALVAIGLGEQADRHGTWHATCRGETTWHRFALRLAERLGLGQSWEAIASDALKLPAARPPNCLLDNRRLSMYGIAALPSWEEALDDYLEEMRRKEDR